MMNLKLDLIPVTSLVRKPEFPWSDQPQNIEVELFCARTGPNLGDLESDYTSEPYEFFKFYFPDNLIANTMHQNAI